MREWVAVLSSVYTYRAVGDYSSGYIYKICYPLQYHLNINMHFFVWVASLLRPSPNSGYGSIPSAPTPALTWRPHVDCPIDPRSYPLLIPSSSLNTFVNTSIWNDFSAEKLQRILCLIIVIPIHLWLFLQGAIRLVGSTDLAQCFIQTPLRGT